MPLTVHEYQIGQVKSATQIDFIYKTNHSHFANIISIVAIHDRTSLA